MIFSLFTVLVDFDSAFYRKADLYERRLKKLREENKDIQLQKIQTEQNENEFVLNTERNFGEFGSFNATERDRGSIGLKRYMLFQKITGDGSSVEKTQRNDYRLNSFDSLPSENF